MKLDKSDNSRLVECFPEDKEVALFIEKYQFYRFDDESWIKTLPNARLEYWHIFEGGFHIWDGTSNLFRPAPTSGGYPATNASLLFHIPEKLYCMNIKLYLRSLTLPVFQKLYPPDPFIDQSKHFPSASRLKHKDMFVHGSINTSYMDQWAKKLLSKEKLNNVIESLLETIQKSDIQSVQDLSKALDQSPRNLQRITKKTFNLSPKELLSIFRFSQATSHLKANHQKAFIDALNFGYYDQSHFIRECKRISGVSPKELFTNMTLPTPDLMVFD